MGYFLHRWQRTISDNFDWWLLAVAVECFVTLTLFCILGVCWAVATPRWLGNLLQSTFGKVKLSCFVMVTGMVVTAAYLTVVH